MVEYVQIILVIYYIYGVILGVVFEIRVMVLRVAYRFYDM